MAKLQLLAALFCALASVGAAPAPGSGLNVGRRIARADARAVLSRAEEAEDPNKVDQKGQFDTEIALKGGNIQQDTTFPPGVSSNSYYFLPSSLYLATTADMTQRANLLPTIQQVGTLEIEFSNADGRTLVVSENKTPAPPPAGFAALEKSSYIVKLSGGSADNLTVSAVDFIGDPASECPKPRPLSSGFL